MQIDDKKRNNFMEMMRGVAEDHGCRIKFEWPSSDPDNMAVTIMKDVLFTQESHIYWPNVKSQTDIATRIWSSFFEKYHSDPRTSYSRHDVETTKAILNSMYGKSAFNNAGCLSIKKVIFNDPATIVFWKDGTKTVVQCRGDDIYDPEKGMAMVIAKKALGNKGNYCKVFKKWLPKEEPCIREYEFTLNCNPVQAISDALSKLTFGNATVSFEVKKEQDELQEDLHSEIFNNTTPVNRIRGEEKK